MKQTSSPFSVGSIRGALAITALAVALCTPHAASAMIINGQIDDFQDGTTQNWRMGQPINVNHVTDGGPGGAGDDYMETIGNGGFGSGSKLTVLNTVQWTGDYVAAGVTGITMNLNNFSGQSLNLWLALKGAGGAFATTNSVALGPNSGWTNAAFSIAPGSLTAVSGNGASLGTDVNATLAGVTELRLIHSTAADWNGIAINATLGVDNVSAVPLPPVLLLMGSGLLALAGVRRRHRGQGTPAGRVVV